MNIEDRIPVIHNWQDDYESCSYPLYWKEDGLFKYNLIHNDDIILYSIKKFEMYKGPNHIGTNTFMYLYDMNDNIIEKILREENIHNESHVPELNDINVVTCVEKYMRNLKIDNILNR